MNGTIKNQMHEISDRRLRLSGSLILFTVTAFLIVAIHWMAHATLDEVTRGIGRVIPSSEVQVVQNLEGGIIAEITVGEGQEVQRGDVLLKLDPTIFRSRYEQKRSEYLNLLVSSALIGAELSGEAPVYPGDIEEDCKRLIEEKGLEFSARRESYENKLLTLREKISQYGFEIKELESEKDFTKQRMALLDEEMDILEPNVSCGISSKIELLRLKKQILQERARLEKYSIAIPKTQSAHKKARLKLEQAKRDYRYELLDEADEHRARIAEIEKALPELKSRLDRTLVKAPVDGVVKKLWVNTIGEVISPGKNLVEIVPKKDELVVEAKIKPSDIAFVEAGQKAKVKLTAYDFSIYGGLEGRVERIGADAMVEEDGKSYYTLRVSTKDTHLSKGEEILPILPGMVAQVDLLSGRKTVLEYILKPFLKTRERALREH